MVIARYLLNLFSRSKALGTSCVSPPQDGRFAASLPRTHCKLCGFCPQAGHGDHLALDITTQTKAQGVSQGGRRAHSMGPLRAIHPPGNLMTRKSLTDMANLGGPPACKKKKKIISNIIQQTPAASSGNFPCSVTCYLMHRGRKMVQLAQIFAKVGRCFGLLDQRDKRFVAEP